MEEMTITDMEPGTAMRIRIKTTERECPRCEAILVLNDNEQCYECLNCGYIDCGEEK